MLKKLFSGRDKKIDEVSKFKIVTNPPTTETCPYCGYKFDKIPTRKKKCPECENYIFVRFGKLYTEEEKYIKDWLDNFTMQELEVTRNIFNKTRQELSQELGSVASVNDTMWRILNHFISQDKSYSHKRMAYQAMESILKSEGKNTDEVKAQAHKMEYMEGKLANEAKAKAFRKELLEARELNLSSCIKILVKIQTCNDEYVCEGCKKASKVVYTIDEALEAMPIPHNCTNPSCRCWWSFTFPDNN